MKFEKKYMQAFLGASVGYFAIHPLLMIFSHLMIEGEYSHVHSSLLEILITEGTKAFSLMMLPWAISLAVLCGGG